MHNKNTVQNTVHLPEASVSAWIKKGKVFFIKNNAENRNIILEYTRTIIGIGFRMYISKTL